MVALSRRSLEPTTRRWPRPTRRSSACSAATRWPACARPTIAAFRPGLPASTRARRCHPGLLLIPALRAAQPQSDILAQRERQREAAERQAERLDETADRLTEGRTADDPRADLAEELRRISRELRDRPEDLEAQLARLGSLEDALRARLDPSNEQRAAALASLSRSVSRLQSGSDSNPDGDPQQRSR